MKTLTILNLKGGVGKTTTAINLAEYIATVENKRVLLIDADQQGNLTQFYGVEVTKKDNFFAIFALKEPVQPICIKKKLHIIPSNARTSKINSLIEGEQESIYILSKVLSHHNFTSIYDYCIIDCPPSLSQVVVNAIIAADHVVIPITTGEFAFQGLESILGTVKAVKREYNPKVNILGILPTMFFPRRKTSAMLILQLEALAVPVFKTKIRFSENFKRAELDHKSVYDYDNSGNAAIDMTAFAKEVMSEISKK